jgi:hypothetical protein
LLRCFFHLKNKDSLGIDLSQAGQNTRNGSSMFIRYKYGNSTMNTLKYSAHPKWYVVFSSFFPECVAKDSHFTLGVWGSTSLSEHFWTLSCWKSVRCRISKCTKHQLRSTFGRWCWKVHAVVARSIFRSQNV